MSSAHTTPFLQFHSHHSMQSPSSVWKTVSQSIAVTRLQDLPLVLVRDTAVHMVHSVGLYEAVNLRPVNSKCICFIYLVDSNLTPTTRDLWPRDLTRHDPFGIDLMGPSYISPPLRNLLKFPRAIDWSEDQASLPGSGRVQCCFEPPE